MQQLHGRVDVIIEFRMFPQAITVTRSYGGDAVRAGSVAVLFHISHDNKAGFIITFRHIAQRFYFVGKSAGNCFKQTDNPRLCIYKRKSSRIKANLAKYYLEYKTKKHRYTISTTN